MIDRLSETYYKSN